MNKQIVFSASTTILTMPEHLKISEKQFGQMCDLMSDWVGNPEDMEKEASLIRYQDEIGWPWRARISQIQEWNSQYIHSWDSYFIQAKGKV